MALSALPLGRLAAFAVLGAADFLLTAHLLGQASGVAYEANPLARWVLGQHGWLGLAAFKAATMSIAAGLGLVVARYNPVLGGRLMTVCCLAVAGVVGYSAALAVRVQAGPVVLAGSEDGELLDESRHLDGRLRRSEHYRCVVDAAIEELEQGTCGLGEAIDRLAATPLARDPAWQVTLQSLYPPLQDLRALLGASLIQHALAHHLGQPGCEPLLVRLRQEYRSAFGHDLPAIPTHIAIYSSPPHASL